MQKMKVKFYDRDGVWPESEIEATYEALADKLRCDVEHLRFSVFRAGVINATYPGLGDGFLIPHTEFKKIEYRKA